MKLRDIVAKSTLKNVKDGTRARRTVPFRLASVAPQPVDAASEAPDEALCRVDVRVLTGEEIAGIYQKAAEFALNYGLKEWKDDHPLCVQGLMVHTLALACIDTDSPEDKPELFFEGGATEVQTSTLIGPDNITFLYDQQRDWQESCGLQKREMSIPEALTIIHEIVAGDELGDPLAILRPGTRASFIRTMAALVVTLLPGKSLPGTTSDSSTTSGNPSSEKKQNDEQVIPNDDAG